MAHRAKSKGLRVCGRLVVEEIASALQPGNPANNRPGHSSETQWTKTNTSSIKKEKGLAKPLQLEDPALSVALLDGGEFLAFARGQDLVIANTTGSTGDVSPRAFVCNEVESITCLEWLQFASRSQEGGPRPLHGTFVGLALGTSEGWLLIYSHSGHLLARQMLHVGPLLRLRARGPTAGMSRADPSQDLCAVFATALVRIDAVELQSVLRRSLVAEKSGSAGGEAAGLSFRKWRMQKGLGPCSDGAVAGLRPTSLFEPPDLKPHYCMVTVGRDPAIATFSAAEDSGTLSASLLASRVARRVSSAASSAYSLGRATVAKAPKLGADLGLPAWSTEAAHLLIANIGLTANSSTAAGKKGLPVDAQAVEKGESAPLAAALRDPLRCVTSLTVAPRGPLMAAADSLGRVMLLDAATFAVVRIWKGYRDASCAFLETPSPTVGRPGGGLEGEGPNGTSNMRLCLAIFAPRKGVLEVWQLRNGPRLLGLRCGPNCRLLQPASCFGAAGGRVRAHLLDGRGGQLFEISPSLTAASRHLPSSASAGSEGGPPSEWDIYQTLRDVLQSYGGALDAAKEVVVQLHSHAGERGAGAGEAVQIGLQTSTVDFGFAKEEEKVILQLLEALDSPTRQLKALDMLIALRPSLSVESHLRAVRMVLLTLNSVHKISESMHATLSPRLPQSRLSLEGAGEQSAAQRTESAPPSAVREPMDRPFVGAATLRRRTPSSWVREDSVGTTVAEEGGRKESTSGSTDEGGEEHVRGKGEAERLLEQPLLLQLQERQGSLRWQEHLLEVFIELEVNHQQQFGGSRSLESDLSDSSQAEKKGNVVVDGGPYQKLKLKGIPKSVGVFATTKVKTKEEGLHGGSKGGISRTWEPGADLRSWLDVGEVKDEGEKQREGGCRAPMPLPTCGDFLRAFIWNPSVVPPSVGVQNRQGKGSMKGLKLILGGEAALASSSVGGIKGGGEGDDSLRLLSAVGGALFTGLLEGQEAAGRTLKAMAALPLPGREWQHLFLSWYSKAALEELLGVDPSLWLDLLPFMGCFWGETTLEGRRGGGSNRAAEGVRWAPTGGGPAGDILKGGRYPVFFEWCHRSPATGSVLLLARVCSMAADAEQAALRTDYYAAEEEENGGQRNIWNVADEELAWLEEGAEQWRKIGRQAEDAFWLGRAVRRTVHEAELRGYPPPSRRLPSAAETPSFPAAPWAARLQLLISPSPSALRGANRVLNPDDGKEENAGRGGEEAAAGEHAVKAADSGKRRREAVGMLLKQVMQRFPGSCQADILAAHCSLELCRQWASAPAEGGRELLLHAQEHMAQISTLGLKGGIASSVWASLVGPRAASIVTLVERLGRAPTDEECAEALGLAGPTASAAADAVAACEQLLALLFDCAALAEAGLTGEGGAAYLEDQLGLHDGPCRDAVADFRLRAPASERVHSYMLLLRMVGVTLALGVGSVHLGAMFPRSLLTTFPALFQDLLLGHDQVADERAGQAPLEAKLQFLQAALLRQRSRAEVLGAGNGGAGAQYASRSISSLAADLEVPLKLLRQRQGVVMWLLAGLDDSASQVGTGGSA